MAVDQRAVAVGLGEVRVSNHPLEVLVAYGLGSCLGVGMYDPIARVGGLLHPLLPQRLNGDEALSAKYVDSGVHALLARMLEAGALRTRLIVRIAGGANMLTVPDLQRAFNVGERNVGAALAALAALHLNIRAQEVGGNTGRTMRLYVADGRMTVRVIGSQEREF